MVRCDLVPRGAWRVHVGKPRCRALEVLKPSSIANSLFVTTKPTVERINDWLQLKAPPEVFQLIPSKGAPGFFMQC